MRLTRAALFCLLWAVLFLLHHQPVPSQTPERFKATAESLKNYTVPDWYEDAKLGIYFHWAPFSVAAWHWEKVMRELIDKYQPDYIFVDGGIGDGEREYGRPYFRQAFYNVLAHYYNSADKWMREVVLTYKRKFLEPDQAVEDFERSGMDHIRLSSKWQTDDKISVNGWCYVEETEFWPPDYIIGALVDIVSKNGNLLLSVGPKPDGTLREEEVAILKELGSWLRVNGEAIYGSRPWREYGEGSMTKIADGGRVGKFKIGTDGVRFTVKDGVLYASCFGWPESGTFTIKSLGSGRPVSRDGIESITMLGSQDSIEWTETAAGLAVVFPRERPCDYAYVLKIVPKGDLLFH